MNTINFEGQTYEVVNIPARYETSESEYINIVIKRPLKEKP